VSVDALLCLVSWTASAALLVTLVFRRVGRTLPAFVGLIAFELLLGIATRAVQLRAAERTYLIFWIVTVYIDVVFEGVVLVELGKDLLPEERKSSLQLPSGVALFGLIFLALLQLIQWKLSPRPRIWRYTTHAVQLTALIELAGFLALMIWSGLNRLHWSRRGFSIVSGIGFFSVVEFADAIAYSYPAVHSPSYRWLAYLPPVAGLVVILYWLQYFLFEDTASSARNRSAELVAAGRSGHDAGVDSMDSAPLLRLFIGSRK
jgi:hypothetical protein